MIKRQEKILIIVDIPVRDLKACTFVGYNLASKHNCKVIFSNTKNEIAMMIYHRPKMIVMSHLQYERFAEVIQVANEFGIKICILPTEGIAASEDTILALYADKKFFHSIDLFLAWGTDVYEYLIKHVPSEKISLVGAPRYDTHNKQYENIFLNRDNFFEKYSFKKEFPLVTWLSFGGYLKGTIDEALDSAQGTNEIGKIGWSYQRIFDQRLTYSTIQDFFQKYSNQRKGKINFAYRPHPLEGTEIIAEFIKANPQVRLIDHNDPIEETLMHTDVYVGYPCSAAMDGYVQNMNRKTVFVRHPDLKHVLVCQEEMMECADVVGAYEHFERIIDFHLKSRRPSNSPYIRLRENLVKRYLYKADGNSSERTADAIFYFSQKLPSPKLTKKYLFKLLKMMLRKQLKGHCLSLKRKADHHKYLDPQHIKKWIRYLNSKTDTKVKETNIVIEV